VVLNGIGGMGLPHEMERVEANKPLAAALKARGIRRLLYVQTIGTIFYEPFFDAVPGSEDWIQVNVDGVPWTYYDQWFRYIPCINNPEFIDYIRGVLQTAVRELDLDGVFTDNYGYYSYSCYCDHCKAAFRAYLNARYPDAEARQARFETAASFDHVVPPPFRTLGARTMHTLINEEHQILDPVSQEWVRFRCERLGEVTRLLNEAIKEVNPDAVWFINYLYGGIPGLNLPVFHGSWAPDVYPHADLISAEASNYPRMENGVAQGRMMVMKIAKRFRVPLSTVNFRALEDLTRISLAEAMAFNTAQVDLVGDIWHAGDLPQWMRDYHAFYREHQPLTAGADTVADTAVLHSFETLAYTYLYPQESLVLAEQSLFQGGITYNVIFDDDLDHLDNFRSLFLPNVLAMSRERAEQIADWVKRGGSLVVTEDTAILNQFMHPWRAEWLKARKTHLLGELLGIDWPESGLVTQQVGAGRVAVIGRIERPWGEVRPITPTEHGLADVAMVQSRESHLPWDYAEHWPTGPAIPLFMRAPALANNHDQIIEAVHYVLDGQRTVRVETDKPVIPEVTRNANGTFVHLMNWEEREPVANFRVSVRTPGPVESVQLLSPDAGTPDTMLAAEYRDGRTEFVVPRIECYNLVILK
ncbi:MAG TPA: beta-galactosidase, partial [Candidatus Sumerlaeota bacterium]|nr:beta-galactosidase [Candidatus Sumerlaeota bacterium]